MKKKIVIVTAFLLILAGGFTSCTKKTELSKNIWVCNPEPNVTITLTFDSLESKIYVSTNPRDLGISQELSPAGKKYRFSEGDQYFFSGDTLYLFVLANTDTIDFSFSIFTTTMLSQNSMELNSLSTGYFGLVKPVFTYLFTRKEIEL